MRHIDGVCIQRHNRLVETDGPLPRGRYKTILLDVDSYLLPVSRYIPRNPIEAANPLVDDLEDWVWACYSADIPRTKAPETPRRERRRVCTADDVLAAVAAAWGVVGSALTARGRDLGPMERKARQVAMLFVAGRDRVDPDGHRGAVRWHSLFGGGPEHQTRSGGDAGR